MPRHQKQTVKLTPSGFGLDVPTIKSEKTH